MGAPTGQAKEEMSVMSVVATWAAKQAANERSERTSYVNLNLTFLAVGVLCAIYIGLRMYQQAYGLSAGLDVTSPAFDRYWLTLLKVELPVILVSSFSAWTWLWLTRDRKLAQLKPREELRRHFNFVLWAVVYTFTFYWTGSFFTEQDAVWHQTVIRDTSFTPSHIVLFYACIPIYLFFGVGGFLYAMTRIPQFARGVSIPLVLAVLGPALILPNLGYNEWGHAYWLTEEVFSHPLHWGFVVLGWNALSFGGVLMQVAMRMIELFGEIQAERRSADRRSLQVVIAFPDRRAHERRGVALPLAA